MLNNNSGTKKELIIQTPKPVSKSSSFLSKIYLNACVVASDASLVVQTDSNEELSKVTYSILLSNTIKDLNW